MWHQNVFNILRSRTAAFIHDIFVIPVAWFAAYWLRFNLESIPETFLSRAIEVSPLIVVVQGMLFWYFGLYRGVWRFASIPDLVRIGKAVLVGTALVSLILFVTIRMQDVPRAVFPLYAGLLLLLLGGPRLAYRWFRDNRLTMPVGTRVLIVGAGHGGEMLIRDMTRQVSSGYAPIALVDDAAIQQGREIHGVRVRGTTDDLPALVAKLGIELILIAIPSATSKEIRRIVSICERSGAAFRILPRYQDLVSGRSSIKELRDVQIEDLLGREKVSLDWDAIGKGMAARRVLVTGGGGSIGAELCRQIARLDPAKIIVFEQSEYNLYRIDLELREKLPDAEIVGVLGDINDPVISQRVFDTHHPEVVFHAAAYKHVPMLEGQVRAAVINNIFGTRRIAELSVNSGCEVFVLISSDKAVNPANVMGTTKRVAEMCCEEMQAKGATRFVTVRFGNVLGSAGSVVPLFQQQIAAGGPVTVTDPNVTRYFMTIPEACQLILQASIIGQGGEIYVLDMGEPVKIRYLAEQLIVLSGKKLGDDIEIVYTGLRPGEKRYEELFHDKERLDHTRHPKILLAHARGVEASRFQRALHEMRSACDVVDEERLRSLLQELVPESGVADTMQQAAIDGSVTRRTN